MLHRQIGKEGKKQRREAQPEGRRGREAWRYTREGLIEKMESDG